jgi:hypothetical protein
MQSKTSTVLKLIYAFYRFSRLKYTVLVGNVGRRCGEGFKFMVTVSDVDYLLYNSLLSSLPRGVGDFGNMVLSFSSGVPFGSLLSPPWGPGVWVVAVRWARASRPAGRRCGGVQGRATAVVF